MLATHPSGFAQNSLASVSKPETNAVTRGQPGLQQPNKPESVTTATEQGSATPVPAATSSSSSSSPRPGVTAGTGAKPTAASSATGVPPGTTPGPGSGPGALPLLPPSADGPSQLLTQSYDAYRTNPSPTTFSEVLKAFRQLVAQPALIRVPAGTLVKMFPVLQDLGAKAIDAGSGRIWIFTQVTSSHDGVIQWADSHSLVTFVGRRHKIKKVTTTTSWHTQLLSLPDGITLKEARVTGGYLVLVGEDHGSTLWVHAYRASDGTWNESASQLDSIPTFLKENVSGKIAFRGADLIFTVAHAVSGKAAGIINQTIPEAESATYRFWLHLTENGYVLEQHLPNEEQFFLVRHFLEAIAGNRTDVAKSILADPRLISIPRYVGMQSMGTSTFRVIEMASPPSGVIRFRVITNGKDDLIFDIGRFRDKGAIKDRQAIKAIFVAPPDPWLQQLSKVLPVYDRLVPPPTKPEEAAPDAAKH